MMKDGASEGEIYEGAPVVVLGYPEVGPTALSRLIVRQGIVSWVSPTRPRSSPFLVDGHVFPGNSGGPVFGLPAGIDRHGRFAVGGKVAFLGIVTQARIQLLPIMAGGKELELHFEGRKGGETLLAPNFVGIGIVEPVFRVKQLLAAATKRMTR